LRSVLGSSQIRVSVRPNRTPYIFPKAPRCRKTSSPSPRALEAEDPPWTTSGRRRSQADANDRVPSLISRRRNALGRTTRSPAVRHTCSESRHQCARDRGWCNIIHHGHRDSPRDLGRQIGIGVRSPNPAQKGQIRARSLARSRSRRARPAAARSATLPVSTCL
jgi:hypothetical protein